MTSGTVPRAPVPAPKSPALVRADRWSARPYASRTLRVGIVGVPIVASFATAWTLSALVAVPSTFAGAVTRWVLVAAAATLVLVAAERLTRRLAPLATLPATPPDTGG